ncbi:polysaccharide ABC transporter ATP-binding protein [Actinotignum urinale]|uniref:ABC transporter ATP-binding protein n=1 Tax=Actinotignum urinale TaxID=190146 RepID=UPI002A82FBAB|nr:polysaccharide ABC transporter ATP-binding protein [Actinotignum urinale]MDY5128601.1 polysaccharide ABC transporter ATP-binding protein [Actinotignum urinale]
MPEYTRPDTANVIEARDIVKKFTMKKAKSLKERIVNFGRTKAHEKKFTALDHVNLELRAGESLGLAGPNGSGKSTLLKHIGGILTPDSGEVFVRGRVAALLELGAGFHPDLTGLENIYLNASILGLTNEEIDEQLESIIEFSGIRDFIGTQVKFYSSGMYVRLAFAVAVHSNPDILLVDEVLAVGDEPFQRKCMNKIKQFQEEGRSIILVSHSAEQIMEVCDRAVVLQHGKVIAEGPAKEAMAVLHKTYADELQSSLETTENSEDNIVKINDVTIVSPLKDYYNGEKYHSSGKDLDVRVNITAQQPFSNYDVIIDIEDLEETLVFGIDTRWRRYAMPTINGETAITFHLPTFYIGDGKYVFNVKILDSYGVPQASSYRTSLFTVHSDAMTKGYVKTFPTIHVTSKDIDQDVVDVKPQS